MKKAEKELYDFKTFGQIIKAARKAKKWTRLRLAEEINLITARNST